MSRDSLPARAITGLAIDLSLRIPPRWAQIDQLRSATSCAFAVLLDDRARTELLGMVVSELVENAVKYGHWSDPEATIALSARGGREGIVIEVWNPIAPGDGAADLTHMLAWLASFGSPAEAYRARMRLLEEHGQAAGSKMGLVRIAHEASCVLETEIRGPVVVVRARTPLAPGAE